MSRTLITLSTGCALLLSVCSCNGQKEEHSVARGGAGAEQELTQPDTSVYGTLRSHTADSLILTPTYGTEAIRCVYDEARGREQIYGSINDGDRYALLIDPETRSARHIVNITELSGQWFYDDDNEQRGFTFTTAGALSSINPKDASFKKWKSYNGHIILFYTDLESVVENSRDYQSDTTEIRALSADNLDLDFRGHTLHCYRQREAVKVKFNF